MKLNLSVLEDIDDDMEFCLKLAKEEKVIILPGKTETSVFKFCELVSMISWGFISYIFNLFISYGKRKSKNESFFWAN